MYASQRCMLYGYTDSICMSNKGWMCSCENEISLWEGSKEQRRRRSRRRINIHWRGWRKIIIIIIINHRWANTENVTIEQISHEIFFFTFFIKIIVVFYLILFDDKFKTYVSRCYYYYYRSRNNIEYFRNFMCDSMEVQVNLTNLSISQKHVRSSFKLASLVDL